MIIAFPNEKHKEGQLRKIEKALEYLACKGRIVEHIPRELIAAAIYEELSRDQK